MRIFAVLALLLIPAVARAEPIPYNQPLTVSFRPLTGSDPKPVNSHVRYVAGYEMVAHGTSFLVGLSDLQLAPDGDGFSVEAISDWGAAARFTLMPDGQGGFKDSSLEIDPLRDDEGKTFYDKTQGDSEDIAIDPATGTRYASFEGLQRVVAYPEPETWRGKGTMLPLSGLARFPDNEGMEGLTFIHEASGNSLLIGVESGGYWRCGLTDYACHMVKGPPAPGFLYKTVSLAVLDPADPAHDHDILALSRYYDPFTGARNILRLLKLDGDQLTVDQTLLKIAPPLPADNFEGVAAVKTATGYRLYFISDAIEDAARPKLLIFDWTE
ncbi:MAG TPA: esterase-like activity of phytase family protein [Asticcacaulis sp.]|nr:esterase-like activity of phytase family protein [Asticcacaulis sp.]